MEVIVILRPSVTSAESASIHAIAAPRQVASSGVFTADVEPAMLDRVRNARGVERVLRGGEAVDALPALSSETERLFVHAWLASRAHRKGQRPGEALDWDTPGMLPPDEPEVTR